MKLRRCVLAVAAAATVVATTTGATSRWDMNEPTGSLELLDSIGAAHGTVGTTLTRWSANGAQGLTYPYRQPSQDPADPERLAKVPDAVVPDPGDGSGAGFSLTVRYQTNQSYGNITQKGQGGTVGGYLKMENPGGIPRCTFIGTANNVTVKSATTLKGDLLHDVTCTWVGNTFTLLIDGVVVSTKTRFIGTISNNWPVSIGGKSKCDGIKVTCDYFNGKIDFVEWSVG